MAHDASATFSLVTLNGVLEYPMPCPCPECSPGGTHAHPSNIDGAPPISFRAIGRPNSRWEWKHEPWPSPSAV